MRFSKLAVLMVFAVSVAMSPVFSAGSAEGSAASDEPIELVYWSHYSQSPAFVEAFADSVELAAKNLGYDNVTCRAEIIEYSGYEAKYITGFTSGTGPDFFLGYPSDWALNGGKNPVALPFDEAALRRHASGNESLYPADHQRHGSAFLLFPEGEDVRLDGFCGGDHRHQLLLVPFHDPV